MSKIDDILEKSAKQIINEIEDQAAVQMQTSENENIVDIKLAKAKSGARRHINRTIRICAVAAVLMIGLVCALFMGADEDEVPDDIVISTTAYMWKNHDLEYEYTMPVKVEIDLKKDDKKDEGGGDIVFKGDIIIKDFNDNLFVEYYGVELQLEEDSNSAVFWEYERKILRNDKGEYIPEDIKGSIPFDMGQVTIYFYNDWKKFEICYQQPSQVLGEYTFAYSTDDAVFINCGADTREKAIEICIDNFENKIKGSKIADWYRENIKFE